ncbi:MAG: hypothetical protein IAG10_19010 [Planctomycetaceae bacterium]|nr:hypothetical protein [Planctomycetaceae bacterium]
MAAIGLAAWGLPPSVVLTAADFEKYRVLRDADFFYGPAVGYGGVTPPEISAFRHFAHHQRGALVFRYLLLTGSLPALTGLRRSSPMFFKVAAQPFKLVPTSVPTFFGCIIGGETVASLVRSEEPDAVRLRNGQTLESWWDARRGTGSGTLHLDIVGGGYTAMFLDPPRARKPAV